MDKVNGICATDKCNVEVLAAENIKVINGHFNLYNGNGNSATFDYPEGFAKNNCIVIGAMCSWGSALAMATGQNGSVTKKSTGQLQYCNPSVSLNEDNINVSLMWPDGFGRNTGSIAAYYRIALLRYGD